MTIFMIRFLFCNIFISVITGIIFAVRHLFRNQLTARMQYHLWFLLSGLLAVPFLPLHSNRFRQFLSNLWGFKNSVFPVSELITEPPSVREALSSPGWSHDFTLSVSGQTPSIIGIVLCILWITGILVMSVRLTKSMLHLNAVRKSAIPLQNQEVQILYKRCMKEMNMEKELPLCITPYFKSPVIAGLFHPYIYLPSHLISDCKAADIRYMLLHELQHYKHKDSIVNYIGNLAVILYWFNPFLWLALKAMQNDREVACDSAVLEMLDTASCHGYADTLINYAEKVSSSLFPSASGLSSGMRLMKRRIRNITAYKKPSAKKKIQGTVVFAATAALLICLAPTVSTYASDEADYKWDTTDKSISYTDLSPYFGGFDGSFVLYDLTEDHWSVYNLEQAAKRVSPDSTYKIYDALFGLDAGVITSQNSFLSWNKEQYPFESWNADQTLESAMQNSVNWYFQSIDKQLRKPLVSQYIRELEYGNEKIDGGLSSYWIESSLKISPIEQVELLKKLYNNNLDFTAEHMNTVKNSLHIASSVSGEFYGKTGTGCVNGKDINGWFVGYTENSGHTYLFAANIQDEQEATGSEASDITLSILADMGIWRE